MNAVPTEPQVETNAHDASPTADNATADGSDRDRTVSSRDFVTPWLTNPVAILSLLFAVCYAVARVAYDSFYSALGLLPEAVGLTQLVVVARSGALVGLVIALISANLSVGFLGYRLVANSYLITADNLDPPPTGWPDWTALLSTLGMTLALLLLLLIIAKAKGTDEFTYWSLTIGIGCLTGAATAVYVWRMRPAPPPTVILAFTVGVAGVSLIARFSLP